MGFYDIALICKNGHIINGSSKKYPEDNSKFCNKCGAESIDDCPKCNVKIKGDYHSDGYFGHSGFEPPSYCENCGEAYPWIKSKLVALDQIIDLIDELSNEEKEELKHSGREISSDNPRTELGVLKIKKLTKKAGEGAWSIVENMIVQIASETAIKAMEKQGML